jgi:rhodanese-related sulfurtransferase
MRIMSRLRAAGLAAVLSLTAAGTALAQATAPVINAPSAKGLAEAGGLLLDIRSASERQASGTPSGAVTIPLQDDERRFRNDFVAEVLQAAGGDMGRPIAIIDQSGQRSQFAARLLALQGFTQAFAVGEGLFGSNLGPGWVARGLPMDC